MAQRTVVTFIDDISGEPADETLEFGLDKARYTIDLSEKNARQLHDALEPFIAAARRIPARKTPQAARPARPDKEQSQAVRVWARANGHEVADRGRIPEEIRLRFNAAHASQPR